METTTGISAAPIGIIIKKPIINARIVRPQKKLDKDRFRKDLGDVIESYQEVARRIGILHEQANIRPIKFSKPTAVKIKRNK